MDLYSRDSTLIHNGRPTRRAKIQYLLRGMNNDPLTKFIEVDTDAMLELYQLYGRLHGLKTGVTEKQLRVITFKTECYLEYVLMAVQP